VKIENQEVWLAFGFYQTFYDILSGACKNHWGAVTSDNPLALMASKFKKFSWRQWQLHNSLLNSL
jgi:hypothetical protein